MAPRVLAIISAISNARSPGRRIACRPSIVTPYKEHPITTNRTIFLFPILSIMLIRSKFLLPAAQMKSTAIMPYIPKCPILSKWGIAGPTSGMSEEEISERTVIRAVWLIARPQRMRVEIIID